MSVKIADTVHELQRERGRTAQFLGAKGAKFETDLQTQRGSTDARIAELTGYLSHFDTANLPEMGRTPLAGGVDGLRNIGQLRDAVSAPNTSNNPIKQYTGIIDLFLEVVDESMRASSDPQILAAGFRLHQPVARQGNDGPRAGRSGKRFCVRRIRAGHVREFHVGQRGAEHVPRSVPLARHRRAPGHLNAKLSDPVVGEVRPCA